MAETVLVATVSAAIAALAAVVTFLNFHHTHTTNRRKRLSECIDRLLAIRMDDAKAADDASKFPKHYFGMSGDSRRFLAEEAVRCFSTWPAANVTNWERTIIADAFAAECEVQIARRLYEGVLDKGPTGMEAVVVHRNYARMHSWLGHPERADLQMQNAEALLLSDMDALTETSAGYELSTTYSRWAAMLIEPEPGAMREKAVELLGKAVDSLPRNLDTLRLDEGIQRIRDGAERLQIQDATEERLRTRAAPQDLRLSLRNEMRHSLTMPPNSPELDDAQRDKVISALAELTNKGLSYAVSYTNVILVVGYASAFTTWSFTKSQLPERANVAVALALLTSITVFVMFEIFRMIINSRVMLAQRKLFDAALTNREFTRVFQRSQLIEARSMATFTPVWIATLIVCVSSALAAGSLLAYNFLAILLHWSPWPV